MLVIFIVAVPLPPEQVITGGFTTVESGSQSTADVSVSVSVDIFVKFPDVNESVILHIIVEPSGTDAVTLVSVADEATDKFDDAVVNELPLSSEYSTR